MKFSKSICRGNLGLALMVTSVGCLKPNDAGTTKPTVQTRKTIGKTTQNVLELKAARQAGGIPAAMAITSSGIGVAADAYRTSIGKIAVLAVEQKMQMHRLNLANYLKTMQASWTTLLAPASPMACNYRCCRTTKSMRTIRPATNSSL